MPEVARSAARADALGVVMRAVSGVLAALTLAGLVEPSVARAQPIAPSVRDAVVRGDDALALVLIETLPSEARSDPRIVYLEARLMAARGEHARAAGGLERTLADVPAAVARDARRRLGHELMALGRFAEAEARLLEITPQTRELRALVAQAVLARGESARAEPLLAAAIAEEGNDTDGFALRIERAEALASLGRRDDAIAVLWDLLLTRPEHPDDTNARLALETLIGGPVILTFEQALTRAERLSDRFARDRALVELRALGEPAAVEERARYRHVLGMVEYAARHDAIAESILLGAVADGAATVIDDAFFAARAGLRASVDAAHVAALRAWADANPRDARVVEALHLCALAEVTYDPTGARASLRALVRRARSGDYAREARFRLGLFAFDAREWRDADELFERTSSDADVDLDRFRARYWRARVAEARGRASDAIDAYRSLVTDAPLGWYALMSRGRLARLGEPEPPVLPLPAIDELWSPSRVELSPEADFYATLGLLSDAAAALGADEGRAREASGVRALVAEYQHLGEFERAYRLTASAAELGRPPSGGAVWAWAAAFPRAFEDPVRQSSRAAGIVPALVWAVMRQESAFNPIVVSVSDAIGLMQMLPATGVRTAAGLGIPFRREDLFEPAANVRLGAAYLGALIREFGPPLGFAAYNAGEHRVRQWLVGRECEDLDRFVDTIPFSQTRNYTRRVAGSFARYTALEAGAAGWPALGLVEPAGGARCTSAASR